MIVSAAPGASESHRSPAIPAWRRAAILVGYLCIALIGAEASARLDDWFFRDTPILANPSGEDLFYVDEHGIKRGRPLASFQRAHLNSKGLLGPEIGMDPAPGCRRWLILGASETFGQVYSADGGYPGRLRQMLPTKPCIEVINGAFPGMLLPKIAQFYDSDLSALHPTTVLVYAPTHFYLMPQNPASDGNEGKSSVPAAAEPHQGVWDLEQRMWLELGRMRLVQRMLSSAELPAQVQRLKWHHLIDSQLAALPPDSMFSEIPAERMQALLSDLTRLIHDIRANGAEPVLITHAIRSSNPPRAADMQDLLGMRVYVPQAPEPILAAFEYAAAEQMRKLASDEHVKLIDASAAFSGKRDLFIDLVHYSPAGETQLAALIEHEMN